MTVTCAEPVTFHRVVVRAPSAEMAPGWHTITPPADAFDSLMVRITPVCEVLPGDTVIGTVQPHYDSLLTPKDQAQWVSYFSYTSKPQQLGARPFDAAHCDLCTHNATTLTAHQGCWTVDGCTTYRPDDLVLTIPRELTAHRPKEKQHEPRRHPRRDHQPDVHRPRADPVTEPDRRGTGALLASDRTAHPESRRGDRSVPGRVPPQHHRGNSMTMAIENAFKDAEFDNVDDWPLRVQVSRRRTVCATARYRGTW